jgi:hypothetical protein
MDQISTIAITFKNFFIQHQMKIEIKEVQALFDSKVEIRWRCKLSNRKS